MENLVAIATIYGQAEIQCPEMESLELAVLKRAHYMSPKSAIKLVRCIPLNMSPQLVEACDRIVGSNAADITPSMALDALEGFLRI